jgi:hypothetical protein
MIPLQQNEGLHYFGSANIVMFCKAHPTLAGAGLSSCCQEDVSKEKSKKCPARNSDSVA